MKGCIDCKNKDWSGGKCKAGNIAAYDQWWAENATKTRNDVTTEAACFEPTEFAVRTDKMINLVQKTIGAVEEAKA